MNGHVACRADHNAVEALRERSGRGVLGGLAEDRATYQSYARFSDPDGNQWLIQEITTRLPGR